MVRWVGALVVLFGLSWATRSVILTGYPPLALLEDGKSVCPDGRAGMDVADRVTRKKPVKAKKRTAKKKNVVRTTSQKKNAKLFLKDCVYKANFQRQFAR